MHLQHIHIFNLISSHVKLLFNLAYALSNIFYIAVDDWKYFFLTRKFVLFLKDIFHLLVLFFFTLALQSIFTEFYKTAFKNCIFQHF